MANVKLSCKYANTGTCTSREEVFIRTAIFSYVTDGFRVYVRYILKFKVIPEHLECSPNVDN
eukprot:jgi/Bigna1/61312/fgenesh1_kg.20_\